MESAAVLAVILIALFIFLQAEDGIRDLTVTGVQTCALPILRISRRSISHCVASSTSGNWIAWFFANSSPKGLRSRAYLTLSSTQYWAAPSDDAAWRIRFWWTKLCASASPRPSSPSSALSGTKTLVSDRRGWSVGMLKVHIHSSISRPGVGLGTR